MTGTPAESFNTGEGFKRYFDILPALTDSEKQAAFRIRHSVYCEDLGWEATRADGMESDAYDVQSLHCLIRNRASGDFIGCVRLICPESSGPLATLPFERTCGDVLDRSIIDPAKLRREDRRGLAACHRRAIPPPARRGANVRHRAGQRLRHAGPTAVPVSAGRPLYGRVAIADLHGLEKLFLLSESIGAASQQDRDHQRADR